ncbi:hypothetical protein TNCV_4013861 [Trichonephila clavipes]|nr:hypothetical protein TNCV_4013861 [Trichonephila clavipes]
MEESENDVGTLVQLLLYADEHYLAGKLPLRDHLGKVPSRVHCSQQFLTAYSERSTLASNTARRPSCSSHPDDHASHKLA